jgi:hypothetical protein
VSSDDIPNCGSSHYANGLCESAAQIHPADTRDAVGGVIPVGGMVWADVLLLVQRLPGPFLWCGISCVEAM